MDGALDDGRGGHAPPLQVGLNALREIFAHCPVVLEETGMQDLLGASFDDGGAESVWEGCLPTRVIIHNAWLSKGWPRPPAVDLHLDKLV